MKIVEIRKLGKNYQITFDDSSTLIVDEDVIVNNRLIQGKEVDDVKLLKNQLENNKLYNKAVRFALYGKSENQMIEYLNKEGMENTYDFIMRLRKDKLIDDYKLIKNLKSQGYSYLQLLDKLNHYKLDKELIENSLETYDESYALKKEFSKAIKKYSKETYQKRNEKIYRYLVSKGFNEEKVSSLMGI